MMPETAIALVLVLLAVVVSRLQHLDLEVELGIATLRALVQLLALSSVIHLVFGSFGPSAALVAVMIAAASWTSAHRLNGVPGAFAISIWAIGAATVITTGILFATGVFRLEPRFLIVVGGMIAGNCMTATSLAGSRLRDEVQDKTLEIEARLALGVSVKEALDPYARRAVVTSFIPTLDATKNVGLVAVPGAFVGMVLAGAPPLEAAQTQAIVMFMLLAAVSISGTIASRGVARAFAAPGERLDLSRLAAG